MRRGECIQRLERLRATLVFNVVDQLDESRREWRRDPDLVAQGDDNSELGVDLGSPLADREVSPNAAVSLGGFAVVSDERLERRGGGAAGRRWHARERSNSLDCPGGDPARRRD